MLIHYVEDTTIDRVSELNSLCLTEEHLNWKGYLIQISNSNPEAWESKIKLNVLCFQKLKS